MVVRQDRTPSYKVKRSQDVFRYFPQKKKNPLEGGSRDLDWWHQHRYSFTGFAISWSNGLSCLQGAIVFERGSIEIDQKIGNFSLERCTVVLNGFLQTQ